MSQEPIWYGVSSGQRVNLTDMRSEDIDIIDIAWSLAHIFRFNGHLRHQISVAKHSIYVSKLLPDNLKLAGLLHDAHEAYTGDVTRQVKAYLKYRGADLDVLEKLLQHQIYKKFGCLLLDTAQEQALQEADDLQGIREIACLAPRGPFRDYGERLAAYHASGQLEPLERPEQVLPMEDYGLFLSRFDELFTVDHKKLSC